MKSFNDGLDGSIEKLMNFQIVTLDVHTKVPKTAERTFYEAKKW